MKNNINVEQLLSMSNEEINNMLDGKDVSSKYELLQNIMSYKENIRTQYIKMYDMGNREQANKLSRQVIRYEEIYRIVLGKISNKDQQENNEKKDEEKNKDIKLIGAIKKFISVGASLSLLKTARDFRKLDKGAKSIVDSIDTSLDNSVERYNANKKVRKEISDLKSETRKGIKETKVKCKNIISTERKKIFESYIDYAEAALGKRKADRDMSKYKRSPEYIKYLEEVSRLKDDIIKEQNQNIRNSKNRKLLEFMGKSKEILIEREQQQCKNKSKEANKQITSSKEKIDTTKKYYNDAVSKYTDVRDNKNGEKSKDLVKQTAYSKMLGAIGSVVDKTIGKNKIYNEIKKVKDFVKGIPSGVASAVGSASTGIYSSLKGKIMAKVAQMENKLSSLKNENNPERVNTDQTRDNDSNEYGEQ